MRITKRLSLVVIAVVLASLSSNAQTKTNKEKLALKGKVKTLRTETFEAYKQGETIVESRRKKLSESVFNETGNIIEGRRYKPDGLLYMRVVNTYNDKEEKTETLIYFENRLNSKYKYTYRYLSLGRIEEAEISDGEGKPDGREIVTYDSRDNITESIKYKKSGEVSHKSVATFDSDGRMMTSEHWLEDKLVSKYIAPSNKNPEVNAMYNPFTGEATSIKSSPRKEEEKDSEGNWTKQICGWTEIRVNREANIFTVTRRVITYH